MTRREIIRNFGKWSALAIVSDFYFFRSKSYKVVIYNTPKSTLQQTQFSNIEEFWSNHSDSFAESLNKEFLDSGKMLSMETYLSKDQKIAVLVKYYRSKMDYEEYVSLLSNHHQMHAIREKANSISFV